MTSEVIAKHVALFNKTFDALDKTIDITKFELSVKADAPIELVNRVAQYKKVVAKQRAYANQLLDIKESKTQFTEFHRALKLINELTKMILEDAREILAELKGYNQ